MALKRPVSVQIDDGATQRAVDSISRSLNGVIDRAIVDGVLVSDVAVLAGVVTDVSHGLGREPRGRIVVAQSADGRVWDAQSDNPHSERTWRIVASADMTLSFWFF